MKTYILHVTGHGRTAKNKGCIGYGPVRLAIRARDNDDAYRQACEQFEPEDRRPLAGKSYIRPVKVVLGKEVVLAKGYPTGYNKAGEPVLATRGVVSEVLNDDHFSVRFPNYYTEYVDFHVSELA